MSQLFALGGQSIVALASVLPMNIQDRFPLGLTGLISLLSKGLSRIFSSTTIPKHQFFGPQPSYGPILISVYDYWKNHSFDQMDLCWQSDISAFNILSRFAVACLPRSKYLFNLMVAVTICRDFGNEEKKSVTVSTFSPSTCHEVMGHSKS